MQRYICHTNIDEAKRRTWPTDFVACPKVGDYVRAQCGYTLKVCAIYHTTYIDVFNQSVYPRIEVELTRDYVDFGKR